MFLDLTTFGKIIFKDCIYVKTEQKLKKVCLSLHKRDLRDLWFCHRIQLLRVGYNKKNSVLSTLLGCSLYCTF